METEQIVTETPQQVNEELTNEEESIQFFSLNGLRVNAKCVSLYDGDTIVSVFAPEENGVSTKFKWKCRLAGIDTPEIRSRNPKVKQRAQEAKEFLSNIVLGKDIVLECGKFDKYGRVLVTIFVLIEGQNTNINQYLIDQGHAVEYNGGRRNKNLQ